MSARVYKDHSSGGWLGEGKSKGQKPAWARTGRVWERMAGYRWALVQ